MKQTFRNLLMVSCLLIISATGLRAQIAYSPFVDSIASLATNESILLLTRQLTGDTTVTVNNQIQTINSRHFLSPSNQLAAEFIHQKFQEYGYTPEFQYFDNNRGVNVIATKLGTRYPDKQYIICGHYDNMPSGMTAPGADDNASGTVAVLEAARVLGSFTSDYTIKFAAWDEEEIGLVGSAFYANLASANNDDIIGVLNLDMIAWDSDNDMHYSIATNEISTSFTEDFVITTRLYQPLLSHDFINVTASDHASFWDEGYPAILAIEDMSDFNLYYHTTFDNIPFLNMELFGALVRASIANLATNALNKKIYFDHDPIPSNNITGPRETAVAITSDSPIATGINAPRLYYSSDELTYDFVLPSEIIDDTYSFIIPGFPIGTTITYYFAVQDSAGTMIATLPAGGRGINPPGSLQPLDLFSYNVDYIFPLEGCSLNTPINIPDNSSIYDGITIHQAGEVYDLDVSVDISHIRDTELRIILYAPDESAVILSDRNGGEGDDYSATIFDDQAEVSIKNGDAPFTGSFKPEFPLSLLNGKPVNGEWQLRIVESGNPNGGVLNDWCLHFLYRDTTVNTSNLTGNQFAGLEQNYPNPAGNTTNIKFTMTRQGDVTLNLYDSRGRLVRTIAKGNYQAGNHLIVASVHDLKPGVYYYTLQSDMFKQTRQMVIIK